MTRRECYDRVRQTVRVGVDEDSMRLQLSELEARLLAHGLGQGTPLLPFIPGEDDAPLSVGDAHAALYVYYLAARAYLAFGDTDRFESLYGLYLTAYDDYAAYRTRTCSTPTPTVYI